VLNVEWAQRGAGGWEENVEKQLRSHGTRKKARSAVLTCLLMVVLATRKRDSARPGSDLRVLSSGRDCLDVPRFVVVNVQGCC
jgi:hypothetical protein